MYGGTYLSNMANSNNMLATRKQLDAISSVHLGENISTRFAMFMRMNGFKLTVEDNLLTPYIVKVCTEDLSIDDQ